MQKLLARNLKWRAAKMTALHDSPKAEAPGLDAEKHAKMRDMVMPWEEISDELIWGDYDESGPDIQKIDSDRLEKFCKRFPHFEDQLRSFVDDWNREPMITQEMLAAIDCEEISQAEIDKSWRQAKRILDFYRKLRSVEKERDDLRERLRAIEQAAQGLSEPQTWDAMRPPRSLTAAQVVDMGYTIPVVSRADYDLLRAHAAAIAREPLP